MDGDNIWYEQLKDDVKDKERIRVPSPGKRRVKSNDDDGGVNKCDRNNGQVSSIIISSICPKFCFDSLPEELLVEILKKCPINLIHRYKCVSKRWLELISRDRTLNSKPPFALFHKNQRLDYCSFEYNSPRCVFSENLIFKSSEFSLGFLPHSVDVLGSSNGFLLCKPCERVNEYYVCNPLSEEWVAVPQPPNKRLHTNLIGFVCKLTTTSTGCDFRIVRIPNKLYSSASLRLETYVSEEGKWRESFFGLHGDRKLSLYSNCSAAAGCCEAVAGNGFLHWVDSSRDVLVSCPFKGNGKCKVISGPYKVVNGYTCKPIIGLCNGRLLFLERDLENYYVWELEDYEIGKWFLVKDFSLKQTDTDYYERSHEDSSPFAFHPFDQDIVFLKLSGRIVCYNISSKKMQTVCEGDFGRNYIFQIVLPSWPHVPAHRGNMDQALDAETSQGTGKTARMEPPALDDPSGKRMLSGFTSSTPFVYHRKKAREIPIELKLPKIEDVSGSEEHGPETQGIVTMADDD